MASNSEWYRLAQSGTECKRKEEESDEADERRNGNEKGIGSRKSIPPTKAKQRAKG